MCTREQQRRSGEDVNLAEVGVRRKVATKVIVSLGAAVGVGPQSPRVQLSFGLEQSF
jgi:hypothetical protein